MTPPSVLKNILSNGIAKIWTAGLQLAFVPIYLRLLGPEPYGLVGFYTTLLGSMLFLDQAISPVLTRELARMGHRPEYAGEGRNTLKTFEIISFVTSMLLGIGIYCLAPLLATRWLHVEHLSVSQATTALRAMGFAIACQWPTFIYNAGFVGLQQQTAVMRLRILLTSAQWVGGMLSLQLIQPTIEVFFVWQIVTFGITSYALRALLWKMMPVGNKRPTFDIKILLSTWRFSIGSLAIGVLGSLLTQADKLLIAKYCSLDKLAAYSLCFVVASALSALIAQPIVSGLLPHFANLFISSNEKAISSEYHRWTQLLVLVSYPITAAMIAFADPLIGLWLQSDSPLRGLVVTLLPWVTIGTLFNVISSLPYALQTASGWVRLSILKNVIALIVVLPVMMLELPKHGPIVGGWCWLGINMGYYLFEVPVMHRRLLRNELATWWLFDTLLPGLFTALIFFLSKSIFFFSAPFPLLAQAIGTTILATIILATLLPYPRIAIAPWIRLFR